MTLPFQGKIIMDDEAQTKLAINRVLINLRTVLKARP
jgi:hypothetical protein